MPKTFLIKCLIVVLSVSFVSHAYSDTVVLKNNQRIKGVVVEDYKDRIVLSTMDGEKQIMRNDIKRIIFDLEEQNLTNMADQYQDKNMHEKAYYYYSKALEVNPEYKKARDGINFVSTHLQQKGRMQKLGHIKMLNEEKFGKREEKPEIDNKETQEDQKKLKDSLGIVLKNIDQSFEIEEVVYKSPAYEAGIKKEDILLATWGRAISYMEPREVVQRLVNAGVMDIQVTLERSYMLNLKNMRGNYENVIGMKFGFSEMEGLIVSKVYPGGVADKAGIKKGDVVFVIQGESVRYMSLRDVSRIINARKGDTLSVVMKRDVVMWKKFE